MDFTTAKRAAQDHLIAVVADLIHDERTSDWAKQLGLTDSFDPRIEKAVNAALAVLLMRDNGTENAA